MFRRFAALAALAALSACAGDPAGPSGAVRFDLEFLSPTAVIPGQPIAARVTVTNPLPFDIRLSQVWEVTLVRPSDPDEPPERFLRDHLEQEVPTGPVLRHGEALVDTAYWMARDAEGGTLPSGAYQLQPALVLDYRIVARGAAHPVTVSPWSRVQFANTTDRGEPMDLLANGEPVVRNVGPNEFSGFTTVPAGTIVLSLRAAGTPIQSSLAAATFVDGRDHLVAVVEGTAGSQPIVFPDAGETPNGMSRLRIVHLAAGAPALTVYPLEPNAGFPRVLAPLPYGGSSPYLMAFSGAWTVTVVNPAGDTLLATAPFQIPSGAARTLLLSDGPGGRVSPALIDP